MAHKVKKSKAIWTSAFPNQAKALRPENTKAGGVKSMSAPMRVRLQVYSAIASLYKVQHPLCECCTVVQRQPTSEHYSIRPTIQPNWTDAIHHMRGRNGLLLFDVRYFKAICQECHRWIGNNVEKARELKLLAAAGNWNSIEP